MTRLPGSRGPRTTRFHGSVVVRPLLISAGVVCVALGVVGIFVPLLPTTPFLLLAAACFLRSSERLYRWLTGHRFLGAHVRNYMEHRATTAATKYGSIAMLWCFLTAAAVLFTDSWIVRALLLAVAVGVTAHLLSLKTVDGKPEAADQPERLRGARRDRPLEKEETSG